MGNSFTGMSPQLLMLSLVEERMRAVISIADVILNQSYRMIINHLFGGFLMPIER
jgi:hypothetical protein